MLTGHATLEAENRRLLATIKQQSLEITALEKSYPGISKIEKDNLGVFVLPDISKEEIGTVLTESEVEFR